MVEHSLFIRLFLLMLGVAVVSKLWLSKSCPLINESTIIMIGGFSIDFYLKNIDTINSENTLELVFKFLFIRIDFIFFRGLFVLYFLDFEGKLWIWDGARLLVRTAARLLLSWRCLIDWILSFSKQCR